MKGVEGPPLVEQPGVEEVVQVHGQLQLHAHMGRVLRFPGPTRQFERVVSE